MYDGWLSLFLQLTMGFEHGHLIERSVDSVQRIYAVVIALAISQVIQSLLKNSNGTTMDLSQALAGLPAFVAFLVTLVPVWQGMNRHLDRSYLEKESSHCARCHPAL
jgi:hypothetical protein